MSSASSSEILSFLRIAQIFSSHLKDMATNFWIFLQPKANLLKDGPFDSCVLTLPRLIYDDACDEAILGRHIELFWSESSDDDIDDNDEDEESFSSDGEESEAFDVETERSMLLCQACYDVEPPSSCLLNLKAIVCCSICLQLVAKAALLFHVMKFHAMAPYLDEANDHFTEFLPGRGLDADGNEIEEGDDEEELDGSDEDQEEDDAEDELDGSDEDQEEDSDAEDYIGWNVTQLKDELKRRGVHTATEVNNMRKAALIEALEALDGQCQQ